MPELEGLLDAQRVFEELSFIWGLLASEFVLLSLFARRKTRSLVPLGLGAAFFTLLSFGFFGIRALIVTGLLPRSSMRFIFMLWYILLALLTMPLARACFQLTVSDALYICIAGYALRHIIYVLVHELLARVLWPELPGLLPVYAAIALAAFAALLLLVRRIFAPLLELCGGRIFPDTPTTVAAHVALLVLLMFCTFSCQSVFETWEGHRDLGVELGLGVAVLMLCVQYGALRAARSAQERSAIEQMLRHSAEQYALTQEMVEKINRTCHDLKHTLNALKTVSEDERQSYIEEAERNIERYRQLVHTDNEALNTILAEKSLTCDRRSIRLSCTVDCADLDFLSVPDLYALLGNAIDNAVECVDQFQDHPPPKCVRLYPDQQLLRHAIPDIGRPACHDQSR